MTLEAANSFSDAIDSFCFVCGQLPELHRRQIATAFRNLTGAIADAIVQGGNDSADAEHFGHHGPDVAKAAQFASLYAQLRGMGVGERKEAICARLGIGKTEFYRRRARAVQLGMMTASPQRFPKTGTPVGTGD